MLEKGKGPELPKKKKRREGRKGTRGGKRVTRP